MDESRSQQHTNDEEEKLERAEEAARSGDGSAAFKASVMRARGVGCSPDRQLGLKWLTQSANSGFVQAQTQLAYLYSSGRGGAAQSYPKALYWYGAAAERGDPDALYKLGNMYDQGLGCDRDPDEAQRCWRAAARVGHAKASERLCRHQQPFLHASVEDARRQQNRTSRIRGLFLRLLCYRSCLLRVWKEEDGNNLKETTSQSPLAQPLIQQQQHQLHSSSSWRGEDDDNSLALCRDEQTL